MERSQVAATGHQLPTPDFRELSRNMAQLVEEAGKAAAAYLKPTEEHRTRTSLADEVGNMAKAFGRVAEQWLIDPGKTAAVQRDLGLKFFDLWATTLKRMQGGEVAPVAQPDPRDNRFRDPEWSENPFFDFIKQAYLITSHWSEELIDRTEGIDDETRRKAEFYVRQLSSALSPSNFLLTNPELIRETLKESAANLVRGIGC